jgi:hypothetical protein
MLNNVGESSAEGHLYVLWKKETLELILSELHAIPL